VGFIHPSNSVLNEALYGVQIMSVNNSDYGNITTKIWVVFYRAIQGLSFVDCAVEIIPAPDPHKKEHS